MNVFQIAVKNIRASATRSTIVFLCVLGIAGFFMSTTLVVRGAQHSLQSGIERLGADILVVPTGAELKVETALLIGKPTKVWMERDKISALAAVPGVAKVSPQIYLQSLFGAFCCSVSEMFLIVYDPATDFTVTPWLEKKLGRELVKGEVVGGSYISTPPGEEYIRVYDYNLTLRGNLQPTGTGIDQTIFMTLETAQAMAEHSLTGALEPLEIPSDRISAVMIKVEPEKDPHRVTLNIFRDVLGVYPIEAPKLFGNFRDQMLGLLFGFLALLVIAWIVCIVLMGLVFSMAVNERRHDIAVFRALGATKGYVFQFLATEAMILAVSGGLAGILLAAGGVFLFKDFIAGSMRMPFLYPSVWTLGIMAAIGVALSVLTVGLAALIPAMRISRQEPAIAMRE